MRFKYGGSLSKIKPFPAFVARFSTTYYCIDFVSFQDVKQLKTKVLKAPFFLNLATQGHYPLTSAKGPMLVLHF
jgi:hypothetical protein